MGKILQKQRQYFILECIRLLISIGGTKALMSQDELGRTPLGLGFSKLSNSSSSSSSTNLNIRGLSCNEYILRIRVLIGNEGLRNKKRMKRKNKNNSGTTIDNDNDNNNNTIGMSNILYKKWIKKIWDTIKQSILTYNNTPLLITSSSSLTNTSSLSTSSSHTNANNIVSEMKCGHQLSSSIRSEIWPWFNNTFYTQNNNNSISNTNTTTTNNNNNYSSP